MSKIPALSCSRLFQSTHPLRGATQRLRFRTCPRHDFNPRTPCGVRPSYSAIRSQRSTFQSTHPLRGATAAGEYSLAAFFISIHAPLAGCDYSRFCARMDGVISIHAPLAGCDDASVLGARISYISIHAPLAGCDGDFRIGFFLYGISIHAPLAGCDRRL